MHLFFWKYRMKLCTFFINTYNILIDWNDRSLERVTWASKNRVCWKNDIASVIVNEESGFITQMLLSEDIVNTVTILVNILETHAIGSNTYTLLKFASLIETSVNILEESYKHI